MNTVNIGLRDLPTSEPQTRSTMSKVGPQSGSSMQTCLAIIQFNVTIPESLTS